MRVRTLFLVILVCSSILLGGCTQTKTIDYKDLFKIAKEEISLPLKLETLKLEIKTHFEKREFEKAYDKVVIYLDSAKWEEVLKDREMISLMANIFLSTGNHKKLYNLALEIVNRYPTDQNLVYHVLDSLYLGGGEGLDRIYDSPVFSEAEKEFLRMWQNFTVDDDVFRKIPNLRRCSAGSKTKICDLINESKDIVNISREFQDEPVSYVFTLLAREYLKESLFGLSYRIMTIAIPRDTEYRDGILVRGLSESSVGLSEEAVKSFATAYEIDPGFSDTLIFYIQELYKTEDYEKVIEIGNLILGLEAYTVTVRALIEESMIRLGEFDELRKFMNSQVKKYFSEFKREEFVLMMLLDSRDEFFAKKQYWERFLNEAEVDLWYKSSLGKTSVYFFEKNFGDQEEVPLVTMFSWVKALRLQDRIIESEVLLDGITLVNTDPVIIALVDQFKKGSFE